MEDTVGCPAWRPKMENLNSVENLTIARRLILYQQFTEARHRGEKVDEKTAKEWLEEDQAIISGKKPTEEVQEGPLKQTGGDIQITLSELTARLKEIQAQSVDADTGQVQVDFQQTIERETVIRYAELKRVDGLVKQSNTTAETDRYRFDFLNATTFKITDKWSNLSTTIWGDPHVDVSDVEGQGDGDFKDMATDNSHTTLMLMDGTRVTFTAQDDGIIEGVDIFYQNDHLHGIGQADVQWNEKNQLFTKPVNSGLDRSYSVPKGDTVYAGGDGNDWFTADGKLLWGQSTAAPVNSRPSAVLQMEYTERITQQVRIQTQI